MSGVRHTSEPKPLLLGEVDKPGTPPPRPSSPGVRHQGSEPKPVVVGTLLDPPSGSAAPVDVTVARSYAPPPRRPLWMAAGGAAVLVVAAGSYRIARSGAPQVVIVEDVSPPVVAPAKVAVEEPPRPAEPIAPPAPTAVAVIPRARSVESNPVAEVKGEDGYLTLRTDPWCDVYLGNEKLGTTPLVRAPVPSGKLTLMLRNAKAGAARRLVVVVEPGRESKQTLVMAQGTVAVDAKPGTEVALDGQLLGSTPLEPIDVVEGRHELRLGGLTRVVKVKAGQTEHVSQ